MVDEGYSVYIPHLIGIFGRKTMQTIDKAFAPHIKTVEFEGSKHSLLTGDFNQGAYGEMSAYFKMRFAG